MGTPALTAETERRINLLFPPKQREFVRDLLLDECGHNLPLLREKDSEQMDRFRFAVLKLSGGDTTKLRRAVDLAKKDWRDALMASGFANRIEAHTEWLP